VLDLAARMDWSSWHLDCGSRPIEKAAMPWRSCGRQGRPTRPTVTKNAKLAVRVFSVLFLVKCWYFYYFLFFYRGNGRA
jgi:hypothetical protein